MKKRIISLILSLIMVFSLIPSMGLSAFAAVSPIYYVSATGDDNNDGETETTPFKTITKALTEAGTLDADIILLSDIKENIVIGTSQDITLNLNGNVLSATGANANENCVIRLGTCRFTLTDSNLSTTHYFKVDSTGLWVWDDTLATPNPDYTFSPSSGLNKAGIPATGSVIAISGGCVTGGTGRYVTDNYRGGGLYTADASTFTLSGGTIVGNKSDQGGGVTTSNFKMTGGAICGNTSTGFGGGAYVSTYESSTIEGGLIAYNSANSGGGIYALKPLTITGVTISYNKASTGGGIYSAAQLNVTGGTISNNKASYGGGINSFYSATISGTTSIINNTATEAGGGVYNSGSVFIPPRYTHPGADFVMTGGTISNNKAPIGGGATFGKSVTLGGTAKITGNTKIDGTTANNLYLYDSDYITFGDGNTVATPASGMNVGVTLASAPAQFTFQATNTATYMNYFKSDDPSYYVGFSGVMNSGYLSLYELPTLYFGQNTTNPVEYYLYTNAARTAHYSGDTGTWSVSWSAADNKPQLNLNNFNPNYKVQIDSDCIINLTGTNKIDNLVIANNATFRGDGTLTVSNLTVNATATIDGATVKCSGDDITFGDSGKVKLVSGDIKDKNDNSFYPSALTTLYLAKTSYKDYALYTDKDTCNFEYAKEAYGAEEPNYYASLNLSGELNKNVVFVQDTTNTYSVVLRVLGNDTKLGSLDASNGTVTVQSESGKKITISGDVKTQKLFMAQCNGLTMEIQNGSIIATEGSTNEFSADSITLSIKNGGINFEKGTVTFINSTVNISKNSEGDSAPIGIYAHRISLDHSALTIKDVTTGVSLYEPTQYGEGAVLSIGNSSSVNIDAANVGVQGTYGVGGNYYNNITVLDVGSTFSIKGGTKAVASVAITPIPSTMTVRGSDNKAVVFKINNDASYTTDYYYTNTTTVAKELNLINKSDFVCKYTAPLTSGQYTLLLGGKNAGTFTIAGDSRNGFTLKNGDKYVAIVNGELVTDSDTAFTWKYNGGLYVSSNMINCPFISWLFRLSSKQYLAFDGQQLVLSSRKVCAEVEVIDDEHTFIYLHDGDGKHEAVCTKCGHHENPEDHTYVAGKCVCGKEDPSAYLVTGVTIAEKEIKQSNCLFIRSLSNAKYQYTITPQVQNVTAIRVEYSFDSILGNRTKWTRGTTFKRASKLQSCYIRVTDSSFNVTVWQYDNGKVTKVN